MAKKFKPYTEKHTMESTFLFPAPFSGPSVTSFLSLPQIYSEHTTEAIITRDPRVGGDH